jgi:SPP1 gp7 family putative phage head morphogenesis protein
MSINKNMLNADIKNQIDVLRFESGLIKKTDKLLNRLSKDIEKKMKNTRFGVNTQTKLKKYKNDIDNMISKTYVQLDDETNQEYQDLMSYQTDYYSDQLNKNVGVTFANEISSDKIERLANSHLIEGSKSSTWWKGQENRYSTIFNQQMKLGLAQNETIGQLTTRFRQNVANISSQKAKSLVRTSVIEFSNTAKMETYRANDDVVAGIQWLSTLDNRTTVICIGLDGLIWDLDLKPIGHSEEYPGNTAHWGCRSTQLSVLKDFDKIENNKLKGEIEKAGTKKEFTGKVTPHKSFETWLKEQPAKQQNEILGTFKAQQWRKGKIKKLRDLTNQKSRPLTIKELRKKYKIEKD